MGLCARWRQTTVCPLSWPGRLWGPKWVVGARLRGSVRPGRKAEFSPSSSTDVKHRWSNSFTPRYDFTELDCRSSVIAALRLDEMWFESQQEQQIRLSSKTSSWFWRLLSRVFSGYWCFLQGLKRPKREVDHSRSSSTEVNP